MLPPYAHEGLFAPLFNTLSDFKIFYAKPNWVISFLVVLVVGNTQIPDPPTVMQSTATLQSAPKLFTSL